jgi:RNA polymerase sigma-70 factor (ECF subfamily)
LVLYGAGTSGFSHTVDIRADLYSLGCSLYCSETEFFTFALVEAQLSPQLARCLEPADLVQSVFGAFFEKVSDGYYAVPAGQDLWGLFLVITLNKIRSKGDYHGAAKRDSRVTISHQDLNQLAQSKETENSLQQIVQEALEDLLPVHTVMMDLRLQGYEVAEIAARTQRSKRTVERVLQEFRNKLQVLLHEDR